MLGSATPYMAWPCLADTAHAQPGDLPAADAWLLRHLWPGLAPAGWRVAAPGAAPPPAPDLPPALGATGYRLLPPAGSALAGQVLPSMALAVRGGEGQVKGRGGACKLLPPPGPARP
jgi:hypothetical protein